MENLTKKKWRAYEELEIACTLLGCNHWLASN